jgi:hypothetical protein
LLIAGFEFDIEAIADVRDFDEEQTGAELQDAARPRQRNRRGRRSRQLAYQRWQQRLQERARMARGQPPATVAWHPVAQQQQTQRAEALPIGTPDTPAVGQRKEADLSNQATGGHPVETVTCCAAISRQVTAEQENSAKSTQIKPQRKLDHPFIRHAESRPLGIVRPMVAHEEKGRDTSPAVTLRLPRTEPRAFQLPPPLATQQQLAQMGRGARLRYLINLADRESAARAVGTTTRTTNQP